MVEIAPFRRAMQNSRNETSGLSSEFETISAYVMSTASRWLKPLGFRTPSTPTP